MRQSMQSRTRVFFTGLIIAAGGAWAIAQCVNPPITDNGVRPNSEMTYALINFPSDLLPCVDGSIQDWQTLDQANGLGNTYRSTDYSTATLKVYYTPLPGAAAGDTGSKTYDESGYTSGGVIRIDTTAGGKITDCTGFYLAMSHEMGHIHGLGHVDANTYPGMSIMGDHMTGTNDSGGTLAHSITGCDANTAAQATWDAMLDCPYGWPPCPEDFYVDEYGCCASLWSPLLIDLDGKSIQLTGPSVEFDLTGRGMLYRVGWTEPGTTSQGWLALDRNGDDRIDSGLELFGSVTAQPCGDRNGFRALKVFDSASEGGNNDGKITVADSIFSHLLVWIDTNHDGVSDPSELRSISSVGIVSLELTYKNAERRDQFGNVFRNRAKVTFADGQSRYYWDVYLSH